MFFQNPVVLLLCGRGNGAVQKNPDHKWHMPGTVTSGFSPLGAVAPGNLLSWAVSQTAHLTRRASGLGFGFGFGFLFCFGHVQACSAGLVHMPNRGVRCCYFFVMETTGAVALYLLMRISLVVACRLCLCLCLCLCLRMCACVCLWCLCLCS